MDKRDVFNKIAKTAQSDRNYYYFGQPSQIGIIEDLLSYFGIDYVIGFHNESMHRSNLETLRKFLLTEATESQIEFATAYAVDGKSLPEPHIHTHSGNIFVSMPMNSEKYPDVEQIRTGIKDGVERSGNTPYFLDLDAHNQNIVSRMHQEIEGCKMLVADFTHQNCGVYYEAGYASARGKTVIHTCRKSDWDNVHFDIKQMQFIIWSTENELAQKLEAQIRACCSS